MTYESLLRPHIGELCKCLPIQGIGMWELVVPATANEHNCRLIGAGKDCVKIARDEAGPLKGLVEIIPYSRLATFIPGMATGKAKRGSRVRSGA